MRAGGELLDVFVHDVDGGARHEARALFEARKIGSKHLLWAGPDTLATSGPGFVALRDVDGSGELRYLVGGP